MVLKSECIRLMILSERMIPPFDAIDIFRNNGIPLGRELLLNEDRIHSGLSITETMSAVKRITDFDDSAFPGMTLLHSSQRYEIGSNKERAPFPNDAKKQIFSNKIFGKNFMLGLNDSVCGEPLLTVHHLVYSVCFYKRKSYSNS